MHELSICYSLVETAERAAREAGATRVLAVHLRLGGMAGVVKEALDFSYGIATEGTLLAGSKLVIEDVPVVLYCSTCVEAFVQQNLSRFRCPRCDRPAAELRQGRELEIQSIEIEEGSPAQ